MKTSVLIDFIQKKVNSIIFRIILISYAIFIIEFQSNSLHTLNYYIEFFLFIILFFLFNNYARLRLINDFILIFIVLINKDPNFSVNFLYIMLPIINSINYSGDKKSNLLYLISGIVYFGLLLIYQNDLIYVSFYSLFCILFLWIINSYTFIRTKIRYFSEQIDEIVENFYLSNEHIYKFHKIYNEINKIINKHVKQKLITDLICFKIVEDKLVIINGSSFIWTYDIPNQNEFIKKLKLEKSIVNYKMSVENKIKPFSLSIYISIFQTELVYVFITNKNIPLYYSIIGIPRILNPSLSKVTKVLISEQELQDLKNVEMLKLAKKTEYVNRANKTMHYIRNRLGPFSNLLTMLENIDTVPVEKQTPFLTLVKDEKERAKNELKNITERAKNMLDKSSNPFVYTQTINLPITKVFTLYKNNFNIYFPNDNYTVTNSSSQKKYTAINEDGFVLFLSDWLANMKKYRINLALSNFIINDTSLKIQFLNDHNLNNEDIDQMINDLTLDNRNEIMKRTTHGLYIIKSTLSDMNIKYTVTHDSIKRIIDFTLYLEITEQ